MASASPPTPRVERVSPTLAYVASESDPYAFYRVAPDSCSCLDWHYRRLADPEHRCKHMELAFPIRCTHCGTNQVPAAGELCSWCAYDLNDQALRCECGRGMQPVLGFEYCALCLIETGEWQICNSQGLTRRLRALQGFEGAEKGRQR